MGLLFRSIRVITLLVFASLAACSTQPSKQTLADADTQIRIVFKNKLNLEAKYGNYSDVVTLLDNDLCRVKIIFKFTEVQTGERWKPLLRLNLIDDELGKDEYNSVVFMYDPDSEIFNTYYADSTGLPSENLQQRIELNESTFMLWLLENESDKYDETQRIIVMPDTVNIPEDTTLPAIINELPDNLNKRKLKLLVSSASVVISDYEVVTGC